MINITLETHQFAGLLLLSSILYIVVYYVKSKV